MENLVDSKTFAKLLGDESVQSIRCSICLDFFERPVVLTCGHTFCFRCIKDTADHLLARHHTRPPWHVYVECPQCRKPTNAYQTSHDHLPVNYTVSSLLSALRQVKVHSLNNASTNTDPVTGTTNEQPDAEPNTIKYVYDANHLNTIQDDLENIFNTVKNKPEKNVIDDARKDIDEITHSLTLDDIIEFETKIMKPIWSPSDANTSNNAKDTRDQGAKVPIWSSSNANTSNTAKDTHDQGAKVPIWSSSDANTSSIANDTHDQGAGDLFPNATVEIDAGRKAKSLKLPQK